MDDEGMFEMSGTSVTGSDLLYRQSTVVNDWLTTDDDSCSAAGDLVTGVMSSAVNKSVSRLTIAVTESPVKQEILNTVPYRHTVPTSLDFTSLIVDLIHQYAAQVSLSLSLSVCLSHCAGVSGLCVCLSLCLSVCLSVCLQVCVSVCLYVQPITMLHLHFYLSTLWGTANHDWLSLHKPTKSNLVFKNQVEKSPSKT